MDRCRSISEARGSARLAAVTAISGKYHFRQGSEAAMVETVQDIYEAVLENLRKVLGG